ncbi:hypothetical protein AB1388_30955, partial [Streptomyces hydrogenans]
ADTPELHAPDGLLAQLAAHIPRVVLAVVPSYTPRPRPRPHPQAATERMAATEAPERSSMLPEPLRGPAFSSYAPEEV